MGDIQREHSGAVLGNLVQILSVFVVAAGIVFALAAFVAASMLTVNLAAAPSCPRSARRSSIGGFS